MLNIPDSADEVVARSKADVQRELQQSNPFLKNSWLGAIVTGAANRIFDFYIQLNIAIRESFPDTATGIFLTRWAAIWGKQLLAATKSNGKAVATGAAGSTLATGTIMSVNGVGNFVSIGPATISAQVIDIDDLTRVGTTVTAKTPTKHNLANGVSTTIADAVNTSYNGTFNINVLSATEFQYEIIASPPDEIGTTATAAFTAASVPIESEEFGASVNLDAGTNLKLQSPIVGVDDTLMVDFGAIGGGTDQETEGSLRDRTLDKVQNPVANFNVAAITEISKEVAGVTRVFVQSITPAIGQVTVYFMRDNDTNPIPSGAEVAAVRVAIEAITPVTTDEINDLFVLAPTGVPVTFSFSALVPDTSTMRTAIKNSLQQFFEESTDVGVNIDQDAYRAAIFNTVDTVTGQVVQSFDLTLPVGDVTILTGEIGTLDMVIFP